MKWGICVSPDALDQRLNVADYIELPFSTVAQMSADAFDEMGGKVSGMGLSVEAMNLLLPGGISLFKSQLQRAKAMDVIVHGMARARQLGVEYVVFGSGAARTVPEGQPLDVARGLLVDFAKLVADMAMVNGITVVMEPLNTSETNLLNTVSDTVDFVRTADHVALKLLADYYHMARNGEDMSGILKAGSDLRHCHIAVPEGRVFPMPGRHDFTAFVDALKAIGYEGRVSIEGSTPDLMAELPEAIAYLRTLA